MTLIGVAVVTLYASRACYNLVVLALADVEHVDSFDYDWYNVSDQVRPNRCKGAGLWNCLTPDFQPVQADLRSSLGDGGYVVFGVVLFVWELLPTSLVVFFFRVRRPPQVTGWLSRCGHVT